MVATAGLLVALLTGAAGAAWACVPQPYLVLQPRASGPPGSAVTVEGQNFSGRSEVRWNGTTGELLGSAEGTELSIAITIPDVPDGMYTLVVVSRDQGGGIQSVTPAAFQVGNGQRASTGTGPGTSPPRVPTTVLDRSSERSVPLVLGLAIGAVLLVAGGMVGATLVRRRRPAVA